MNVIVISVLLSLGLFGSKARETQNVRGYIHSDLSRKLWHQLPSTRFPGFMLPPEWKGNMNYAVKMFEPDAGKYVVTLVELPRDGDKQDALILSAVDFTVLKKKQIPLQDCFYKEKPSCDGRLCNGLLVGVIDQNAVGRSGFYSPLEVWKITPEKPVFERVATKNVICKVQSYAE